jgi:hypothetical protein
MRLLVALLLVVVASRAALVENEAVRIRYGNPVHQEWAELTFERPTTLPNLEYSDSYDSYMMNEYVSVEDGPFYRIPARPGLARLSLHPASELLITARCLAISAHELLLSTHPCPTTPTCIACDMSDSLCAFNTTDGRVELLADETVLVPDLSRQLRFGSQVALGPILLRPGEPWIRTASTGSVTRLSLDAVGYEQTLYFDLGDATLCTKPRRIVPHRSFVRSVLSFVVVLAIAGLWTEGWGLMIAVPVSAVVIIATLVDGWVPLRLEFPLAGPIYVLAAGSMLGGVVAVAIWYSNRSPGARAFISNGLWATLWYQQYQFNAGSWESLAGAVVLGAWTWVALRSVRVLRPLAYLLVAMLWWVLTLRNPLLVTFPAAPAGMLVALAVFIALRRAN